MERTKHYSRVFANGPFVVLIAGQGVSTFGDALFNVAVVWSMYSATGSILLTAVVQAMWHLATALIGIIAGTAADAWDRKRIIVASNAVAAVMVGSTALFVPPSGRYAIVAVLGAVFLLNGLVGWAGPARAALMPRLVGTDLMVTASGVYSTVVQTATFAGNAAAGIIVAAVGAGWAVLGDATSFAVLALAAMGIPQHASKKIQRGEDNEASFWRQCTAAWTVFWKHPVIKALVTLNVLINVSSFIGPMWPALVHLQLHSGAAAFGLLEAIGVIGGALGGIVAGGIERRVGAGRMIGLGWGLGGAATLAIGASTSLLLTAALEIVQVFGLVVGAVASGTLLLTLVEDNFRGRVVGMNGAISVLTIPLSSLVAGMLADHLGPGLLVEIGGVWMICVAILAAANPVVRASHIDKVIA